MSEMNKKGKVDWSKIDGSSPKPRRLHLEKEETDSLYHCPIQVCDHDGFKSQRGCRKHVITRHSWFFFFDEKPDISSTKELADDDTLSKRSQNNQPEYCLHFQFPAKLANYSRNG